MPLSGSSRDSRSSPITSRVSQFKFGLEQLLASRPSRSSFATQSLQLVAECAGVRSGVLLGYDRMRRRLDVLASIGIPSDVAAALAEIVHFGGWQVPLQCLQSQRISVIEGAHENRTVPRELVNAAGGSLTIAALPLVQDNLPAGVLLLFAPEARGFPDSSLQVLSQLTPACADGLNGLTNTAEPPPREESRSGPNRSSSQPNRGAALGDQRIGGVARPAGTPDRFGSIVQPRHPDSAGSPGNRGLRPGRAIPPERPPSLPGRGVAASHSRDLSRHPAPTNDAVVAELQARIEALEKDLAAAKATAYLVPLLEGEIEKLDGKLRWSMSAAQANQSEAQRLAAALEETERRAADRAARLAELETSSAELRREVTAAEARVEELEESWAASESALTELTGERERLNSKLVETRQESAAQASRLAEIEEARSAAEAARRQLGVELLRARAELTNLHKDAARDAQRAEEFERSWKRVEADRARLEEELSKVSGQIAAAQREQAKTEGMFEHSSRLLTQTQAEARTLAVDLAQATAKLARLEEAQERVAHLQADEQALASVRHQLERAEAERAALQNELFSARTSLEAVTSGHSAEQQEWQARIKELEKDLAARDAQRHELRAQESLWTTRLAEIEGERARLEAEIEQQREAYNEASERLATLESERQILGEELASERSRAEEAIEQLQSDLEATREQEQRLKGRVDLLIRAEGQRIKVQRECERLAEALADAERKTKALQAQIEVLSRAQPQATSAADPSLVEAFEAELREHLQAAAEQFERLEEADEGKPTFAALGQTFSAVAESAEMASEAVLADDASHLATLLGEGEPLEPDALAEAEARLRRLFVRVGLEVPPVPIVLRAPELLDNVDPEMLAAFSVEAAEEIEACEQAAMKLEQAGDDRNTVYEIFRRFHTLKGAAGAVGLTVVMRQLHHGETLLEAVSKGQANVEPPRLADFCLRLLDSVGALLKQARRQKVDPRRIMRNVEQTIHLLWTPPERAAAPATEQKTSKPMQAPLAVDRQEAESVVRVEARQLGSLMEEMTRVTASRGELAAEIEQLSALAAGIPHIPQAAELAAQLSAIAANLARRDALLQQHCNGLQQQITHLRMAPIDTVLKRLVRPTRDAAKQENKLVEVDVRNGEVPIGRAVLDGLYGPLLHVVRNAVAHGIELPEVREKSGKPRTGTIVMSAKRIDDRVELRIEDDGAGIDFDRVLAKARRNGLVKPDQVLEREQLIALLFQPGFSTRDSASDLAGRGVGMDVVAREIAAMGGRIEIDSEKGSGTTFRFDLPA